MDACCNSPCVVYLLVLVSDQTAQSRPYAILPVCIHMFLEKKFYHYYHYYVETAQALAGENVPIAALLSRKGSWFLLATSAAALPEQWQREIMLHWFWHLLGRCAGRLTISTSMETAPIGLATPRNTLDMTLAVPATKKCPHLFHAMSTLCSSFAIPASNFRMLLQHTVYVHKQRHFSAGRAVTELVEMSWCQLSLQLGLVLQSPIFSPKKTRIKPRQCNLLELLTTWGSWESATWSEPTFESLYDYFFQWD